MIYEASIGGLHVSGTSSSDLQDALNYVKEATLKDNSNEYKDAFVLYTLALEKFVKASKDVPQGSLQSLNVSISKYMDRAEIIKEFLLERDGGIPEIPTENEHVAEIIDYPDNVDLKIGLLEKEKTSTFWGDNGFLTFYANIDRNIVQTGEDIIFFIRLDNKTDVKVEKIKVHLEQIDTSTSINMTSQRVSKSSVTPINPRRFKQNGAFPLGYSVYEGEIDYNIPLEAPPSSADNSTCFAREHQVVIQCELKFHNNVKLAFPIRVV
eukprot:TRINITY_DN4235_c0_g3_i1.p1 TRINITY_DN4235_c0_g3~~TRINITY_DN4235_c0_g3_i1.p1  ORF type:complete len:266 (+),score=47.58 TRINITY_DN4235_c0_g3_i1:669-1466(+)